MTFDSTRIGNFIGVIDDSSFNKLLYELENIGLDTINFDGRIHYTDGPDICISVNYNNKSRQLNSPWPTPSAGKLIAMLYRICDLSNMKRTDNPLQLETKEICR